MDRVDQQRTIAATWRPTFYTFAAVFLSILVVGFAAVPWILGFAQRVYLDLASDVNQRQARSMTAFLESRLQAGLSEDEAILEFQAATAGSDVDRGYVCLIERGSSRYLSHPNLDKLGMDVKPGAIFSPAGGQEAQGPWSTFIERGESADGLLTFGPQMSEEKVYFTSVPGTGWTVSTHKNLDRVYAELGRLRRSLIGGAVLLSLLFALPASVAARGVSRRREAQIQHQAELERRLLEEEDARKSLELDQARELQLSLVPRELPRRPEVRMAARMETATEVGGDYYDVIEREDGSLLFALGDATGHGLKAGMMVVAAKSLFAYSANTDDLVDVAARMAKALRTMRLGRLHMAFALAHLTGRRLEVVGAGMPPALIHRHVTGSVEELALSGAPLGSPMDFPYSLARVDLEAGDTLLLMSDGLPELQGAEGEVLGYEGVEGFFSDAVEPDASPEDIVAALSRRVSTWSGRELEDDVTYLVLRVS
ncbi:MAG: SpoIIE family protein phosphatase [Acidobacteriota bacterium]